MNTATYKVALAVLLATLTLGLAFWRWTTPPLQGLSNGTGLHTWSGDRLNRGAAPGNQLVALLDETRTLLVGDSVPAVIQGPTPEQVARWVPGRDLLHQFRLDKGQVQFSSRSAQQESDDDQILEALLALARADATASPQRAQDIAQDLLFLANHGDWSNFPSARRRARILDVGLALLEKLQLKVDFGNPDVPYWPAGINNLLSAHLTHLEQRGLPGPTVELIDCEFERFSQGDAWPGVRSWQDDFQSIPGQGWLWAAGVLHGQDRAQAYQALCQEQIRGEELAYLCWVDCRFFQAVLGDLARRDPDKLQALCSRHDLSLVDPFQPTHSLRIEEGEVVSELWDGEAQPGQSVEKVELSDQAGGMLQQARFSDWMASRANSVNYQLRMQIR